MGVLKNVDVTIEVNGNTLEEFDDDEATDRLDYISKYVEATSEAAFAIKIKIERSFKFISPAVIFDVYLDGKRMNSVRKSKSRCESPNGNRGRIIRGKTGLSNGEWMLQPYMFTELKIENDHEPNMNLDVPNLGIISVEMFSGADKGRKVSLKILQAVSRASTTISEKQMKGKSISHGCRLGRLESNPGLKFHKQKGLRDSDVPVATWAFKYRSKKALQGLLLLRDSQSPPPMDELRSRNQHGDQKSTTSSAQQHRMREGVSEGIVSQRQTLSGQPGPKPLISELDIARMELEVAQANLRIARLEREFQASSSVKEEAGNGIVKRERDAEVPSSKRAKRRPLAKGEIITLED